MGVGLVHYYNRFLNRLNDLKDIEIVNLVSANSRGHLQDGVFQTKNSVSFKVCKLDEYQLTPLYRSFKKLSSLLKTEQPDIIVTTEFYINTFLFNLKVIRTVKKLGIKIVMKSIPFRIKTYRQALEEIKTAPLETKNIPVPIAGIMKITGLEKVFRRSQLELSKASYKIADAHVNYIEDAYKIYSSYGVPEEKIFVTYNSPDTDYLFSIRESIQAEPPILPPCPHRLIHVGRLVQWKRVDMLIASFAQIKKEFPDAELLIIGEGPRKTELKKLAETLQLRDAVRFIGGVYDAYTLGRFFISSSMYVLAGMGGISINDAMCFGLPVVCSVCDGTEKKLVREGVNGLYFEDGNQNDLTQKIIYLLRNPDIIKTMGENSTALIKHEINIHTVLNRYLKAFEYVMQNQS